MTAAAIASNYFLYFAIAWLPTYFSYQFELDTSAASAASVAPFAAAAAPAPSRRLRPYRARATAAGRVIQAGIRGHSARNFATR